MTKIASLILLTLFFANCSSVHFDSPLPGNGKTVESFNTELTGKYYYSDSMLGKKVGEIFYNQRYFKNKYKEVDSAALVSAEVFIGLKYVYYTANFTSYYKIAKFDTIRLNEKHRNELKTIEGNYVIFKTFATDTLLNLDGKDKLFYYHEKYYLNRYVGKKDWDIFQVEANKSNSLSVNLINEEDEKILVDTLKKNKHVFYSVINMPTKKFDAFIDNGGFRLKMGLKKY